ncbi:hypothetical protein [Kiloniella sp. b19]|uniref:hypothetical protein n=1 Tax=Kiloniella sp. GXU_MW_B19 TaxID=3141326 RepID=UPI0031E3C2E2
MTSKVALCNDALLLLGDKIITDLNENTPQARACKTVYDGALRTLLVSWPWGCAIRRALLPQSAEQSAFGTSNAYLRLPDDLKLLPLTENGERDGEPVPYSIEGRFVHTTLEAPLRVRYITSLLEPVDMPPALYDCLAALLAVRLSEKLTGSKNKLNSMNAIYQQRMREAVMADSFERSAEEIEVGSWLEARHASQN